MKRRGLFSTLLCVILVITLAVVFVATFITLRYFEVINWQLFRKGQDHLDLRSRAITAEEYDALAWRMPKTDILWSVPFQGGYVSSDAAELTLVQLNPQDIPAMGYFRNLQVVHAMDCTDYPALMELCDTYPELNVEYAVSISGQKISPDAEAIEITSLTREEAQRIPYLPNLKTIDGTGCRDFEAMRQAQQENPSVQFTYLTSISGSEIRPDATSFETTGASYAELSVGLAAMPNLHSVLLHAPSASASELETLRQEYPNAEIHWELDIYGNIIPDNATEVDLSNYPVGSIENAKEIAAKFPYLEKLIVNSDGIPHEEMAVYRDEVRSDYKVVWTIQFTEKCKARTDETYFMPIKQGEYYFEQKNVEPLRYCEDMVCIDLGHSTIAKIDFVTYMPHLKYLILAWTQVQDISPISSCKELVYLEIDHGIARDLSPLVGCTALEDININDQQNPNSIEPLKQMTWLKTLWVTDRSYAEKMELIEALPNTRVVTEEISSNTGMGWRNLQNYYDMRDFLGMYYMK